MKKMYMYDSSLLPTGFIYPKEYINFIESQSQTDLSPWWLIGDNPEFSKLCFDIIGDKLAGEKVLIPFAKTDDGDDIACFDGNDTSGNPRVYFDVGEESLAGVDWDKRYSVPSFIDWLEMVKEDM